MSFVNEFNRSHLHLNISISELCNDKMSIIGIKAVEIEWIFVTQIIDAKYFHWHFLFYTKS
jgi:hypothetical protein